MTDRKVMLITGTSKGIGRYLAHYYVEKGYKVIGCSRSPVDYSLANYRHFCLDVSHQNQVKSFFGEIRKTYDRLDVLINNAGVMATNHALLMPLKAAQEIFHTNVAGTFLFCQEAVRIMKKNNFGRIVNFASISNLLNIEGESIYAASKAAIVTLSKILAKEFAQFNVTVNVVGPNPIQTDILKSVKSEKIQKLIDNQPIRRLGEFKDVSNVINFFLKSESDFITGQVIYLGGM